MCKLLNVIAASLLDWESNEYNKAEQICYDYLVLLQTMFTPCIKYFHSTHAMLYVKLILFLYIRSID